MVAFFSGSVEQVSLTELKPAVRLLWLVVKPPAELHRTVLFDDLAKLSVLGEPNGAPLPIITT
jgi:hypothetical protein